MRNTEKLPVWEGVHREGYAMTVHAKIITVYGETKNKLFSGWPAMMAYITENWKTIKEFKAKVEGENDGV